MKDPIIARIILIMYLFSYGIIAYLFIFCSLKLKIINFMHETHISIIPNLHRFGFVQWHCVIIADSNMS